MLRYKILSAIFLISNSIKADIVTYMPQYNINTNQVQLIKDIAKLELRLEEKEMNDKIIDLAARLKARFPDFDLVCNQFNFDLTKSKYPELFSVLNRPTDNLYDAFVGFYQVIKKLVLKGKKISNKIK